ncbi:MAG: hypothetical protein ACI4XF_02260 [Oscillospiraceae bacterium]
MNFKKKMSVALAAAVCCSMISTFGIAASAEEYTYSEGDCIVSELYAADPAYTEAVKLAGVKYNSGLAKKVKSYEGKTSKSTVTFSKSRTKKYFDKLYKSVDKMAEDPSKASISISMVSSDSVISIAMKGDKAKYIVYMEEEDISMGLGIYQDSKNITLLDLSSKEKMTTPVTSDDESVDMVSTAGSVADLNIKDSTKGKLFKFKYNDKGYYYEVFTNEDGQTIGCVFDTKLNPVMMMDDTGYYTVKITTSVKSSSVTVPSGYEEIDLGY